MPIFNPLRLLFSILVLLVVSACSSTPSSISNKNKIENKTPPLQSFSERKNQLSQLNQWKISGKIAFIQGKKRQSANINWKFNGNDHSQRLDLNTILGINVLHLKSKEGLHTIEVDGETHKGKNLDQLIYSLTGLIFPSKALTYWLKAIPYQATDTFVLNEQSQLPISLTSENGSSISQWHINYSKYKTIKGYQLPFSVTLKKDNLLIKIAIKKWKV